MKKFTQEQVDAKLKEIQASIPKEYFEFEDALKTPTMQMVVDKAIEDPNFPAHKKMGLIALKKLGMFSQTQNRIKEARREQIDKFLEAAIANAIRKGELPPASSTPFGKKLSKLWKTKNT